LLKEILVRKTTLPPEVTDSKLRERLEQYVLDHHAIHIIPENTLEHFLLVATPPVRDQLWAVVVALPWEQLRPLYSQPRRLKSFEKSVSNYAVEIATCVWSREFSKRYPTGE
jgi:hypothetical protein